MGECCIFQAHNYVRKYTAVPRDAPEDKSRISSVLGGGTLIIIIE